MSQEYPRVYRRGRTFRIFSSLCGLLIVAAGLLGIWHFESILDGSAGRFMLGFCLGVLLAGAYMVAAALRVRVVLHADAIENHGVFVTRRMPRAEVGAYRVLQSVPPRIRLESRRKGMRGLTLNSYVSMDDQLRSWLAAIRNSDEDERRTAMRTLLRDPEIPGDVHEKYQNLQRARRTAGVLAIVTLAVGACVWLYPDPYDLAVIAMVLMPWAAAVLAAANGALYRLNPSNNDVAARLWVPLCLPGIFLAVRAWQDMHIFDVRELLWLTVEVAAACVGLLAWRVREMRENMRSALLIGLFLVAYSYGLVTLVNRGLDKGEAENYIVNVVDLRETGKEHTTYFLRLAAWGPRAQAMEVEVGEDLYRRVSKGDAVCISLGAGALGVRWYLLEQCRKE